MFQNPSKKYRGHSRTHSPINNNENLSYLPIFVIFLWKNITESIFPRSWLSITNPNTKCTEGRKSTNQKVGSPTSPQAYRGQDIVLWLVQSPNTKRLSRDIPKTLPKAPRPQFAMPDVFFLPFFKLFIEAHSAYCTWSSFSCPGPPPARTGWGWTAAPPDPAWKRTTFKVVFSLLFRNYWSNKKKYVNYS